MSEPTNNYLKQTDPNHPTNIRFEEQGQSLVDAGVPHVHDAFYQEDPTPYCTLCHHFHPCKCDHYERLVDDIRHGDRER